MKTLFDPAARDEVLARIGRLRPDAPARWGRMHASQMVCHAADQLRGGLGELDTPVERWPPARWPLSWLLIHVLPWPKGRTPTPPSLLTTRPAGWAADRDALADLVERFAARGPGGPWAPSAAFGAISGRSWGALAYRHLDHHLRQFGV
jgi:hypothetical protein